MWRRGIRAAGSLALLAGLIAGLPVALARLAGNPLPGGIPTVESVGAALTAPDDGTVFLAVLAAAGWLAWASFTGSVAVEVLARLARRPAPRIPGLRGPQRFASVLVAAAAAIAATPTLGSASAAVVAEPAPATAPPAPADAELPATGERVHHLVARGEALLDLQERYRVPWQRIAEANYGVAQPDGRTLQPGQTRIYPGWQLRIPAAGAPERQPAGVSQRQVYEVAEGDWLWHVAGRYLGDPERYRDLAALNPQLADRHGDFPDHIEPGWRLRLPAEAVDSGPARHATGFATAVPAPRAEPAPEPEPEPGAVSGFGPAPEPSADDAHDAGDAGDADDPAGDPALPAGDDRDLTRLAPAALASAGLLTALVLGIAALQQSRRHQHHRPGLRFASPAARLERSLRAAQQPLDAARIDAAMRGLAAGLAERTGRLPDVAGALVDDTAVHLLLASPCPDPPAPWRDQGDRWTLPGSAVVPPAPAGAAPQVPLPALAAVGSQAGVHLLLDLERLGFLTIHGDPARARDLLRYLAAELACNTWSDGAEVLLSGFEVDETEQLVAIGPDRVRVLPSIPDAVAMLRRRIESARVTLGHTGAVDAFTGRVHSLAGDAWTPQILLAVPGSATDRATLAELERELAGAARCAVAVVTTGPDGTAGSDGTAPAPPDQPRITLTAGGTVHARLPFLRASLTAAALPVAELAQLVDTIRAARTDPQVPVPPAPEPEPWAAGTDAAGAARATTVDEDPRLDEDLQDWHADACSRPRIGILGPVTVDASGTAPPARRRLHAELIVFLAQRAGRGARGPLIDAALWPDRHVTDATRQLAVSRARQWLGTTPHGSPWLPDLDADHTYRLAGGYLFDWHLFRRLRTRGETRGEAGLGDLRAALELVRGAPFDGADRPGAPGTRNPYPWLAESDVHPGHLVASIVDTAHQVAELSLAAGDPAGARRAVRQAWLADPARSYDQPWRDLLRAEQADGRTDRLRAVLAELMEARDAEAPSDLAPDTYRLISCWPPEALLR